MQAALLTPPTNIQKKTGKTLAELGAAVARSNTQKHGEKRSWLTQEFGMGYGDANTLIHVLANPPDSLPSTDALAPKPMDMAADPLDAIYVGPKAALRSLHDAVMGVVERLGV